MKKYIVVQLILLSFFVFQSHAMEQSETKQEFLARTKRADDQITKIAVFNNKPVEYCNILSFDKTKRAIINFERDRGVCAKLIVLSVSENKMIFNFLLPDNYDALTSLDFNKQGTHLLVRGWSEDDDGIYRKGRMIIPIDFTQHYQENLSILKRRGSSMEENPADKI